jgi:MFS family permease
MLVGNITGKGGSALLISATVSRLADQSASIAVVLVVIARTHDPRLAGLVAAAFTVPTLVTGPVIGAFLDQLRAKRALFAANQATLAAALSAVVVLAGHAPGAVLIAVGLFAGLTAPVLTGGFSSLVPLVVPPGGLLRANALDAASYNVAGLAGPALVAAIASAEGASLALSAVAGIAALGLLLVLAVPMRAAGPDDSHQAQSPGSAPAAPGRAALSSMRAAVADGLRLLRNVPLLRSATIVTTLSQFAQGLLPVALPLLAARLGHPTSAGAWLLTALSGGGLAGSLASGRLLARRTAPAVLITATAACGACVAALAATPGFGPALGLAALAGIADGPTLASTLTIRQRAVPPGLYAQAAATAASLKTGAYALGAATAGLLAGALTARQLVVLAGIGQLIALVPFMDSRARGMATRAAGAMSGTSSQAANRLHPTSGRRKARRSATSGLTAPMAVLAVTLLLNC